MVVKEINKNETYDFILHKHYAQRLPSISYAYGLFIDDKLEGILTIGKPASNSLCEGVCGKEYKEYVYELNRLCVNEGLPKEYIKYVCFKSIKDVIQPKDYNNKLCRRRYESSWIYLSSYQLDIFR